MVDQDGDLLSHGLMASSRAPFSIYSGFLDPMGDETDLMLMPLEGSLRFSDGHYIVSSLEKFEDPSARGNLIRLGCHPMQLNRQRSRVSPIGLQLGHT